MAEKDKKKGDYKDKKKRIHDPIRPSASDIKTKAGARGKCMTLWKYLDAKDGDDAEVGNSNTGDRVGRINKVHFETKSW